MFILCYTYLDQGEQIPPNVVSFETIEDAIKAHQDGQFIYAVVNGCVHYDATPKTPGYCEYYGENTDIIRNDNLDAYQIYSKMYDTNRKVTSVTDRTEKMFALLRAAFAADDNLETAKKNVPDYLPCHTNDEYVRIDQEIRNRLLNALAEYI